MSAPRFATAWASAVYAVATMLLGYPALVGQFLINPRSDQYLAGFAFRDFAARSLRDGNGFPQWNPYLQGGLPYIGAMHGDIFYPTFLLRMIMPTDAAMTWEFIIHLFLAGLFTFLFLRAWRLGFYSALIGGLAYMLCGSIAGYASPGHDGKLFVSTLLPAALLLVTRGLRDGRLWAWGPLAIVIGLGVLSPHPQLLQYLLLCVGVFALYVALTAHDGGGKLATADAIKRLALATGSVTIGALIGAIQFAPVFEYKPWSPRAGGHDWETATSYSFPIEETFNAYLPQFSGILSQYWGQNGIHFHSDYFGVVVLVLLCAAFGSGVHNKSFRLFWLVTGVVALLWAYGGNTPLFHVILAIVPGTKYFRAPSMIIYVTAFAVAVLAALGAERVFARRVGPKYAIGWGIAALAIAVIMSIGGYRVFVNIAASIIAAKYPAEAHRQVVDYYSQRAEGNASDAIIGAWRSFLFVLLGAGVIWGLVTDRLAAKAAAIALSALVALDLWSIERLYWIFSAPASTLFASDPAIEAIKSDMASAGEPGRALTLPLGSGLDPMDPAFRGDALMAHGVRVVGGYHGNELGLYQRLVSLDSGRVLTSSQLWRHENVRYLYTGADEATMIQAATQIKSGPFVKLAGPVRNAAGSMVYAYRVPGDNPAAWVAAGIVKASDEQSLPTVLDARFDPSRAAIFTDTSSIADVAPVTGTTPPRARVTKYSPGVIDVTLAAPVATPSALVVSENYYTGWAATAGGKALPTSRANYNLIGVAVPAGTESVQLRFRDPGYGTGKTITLAALLIATLATIAGGVVARRQQATAAASA